MKKYCHCIFSKVTGEALFASGLIKVSIYRPLISHEVLCEMGWTGHYFPASQMVNSDIIAIAKSLRGCYQFIKATRCKRKIYETISNGFGLFQSDHS